MKGVVWLASSLSDLKDFSPEAKREAGYQLFLVQAGTEPDDWKPMGSVGQGVEEIRIHAENEYRIIYIARFKDAVYVLHCFAKKTRKTPQREIELAGERFKQLIRIRKRI